MRKKKIVLLATDCDTTHIVYNFLSSHFEVDKVIIEDSVSKATLIKRRISKLGIFPVFGQLAFIAFVLPFVKRSSQKRFREIEKKYQLNFTRVPDEKIIKIPSVNDSESVKVLNDIAPDIIVVNGTRIIGKRLLTQVNAPFINIHTGITPQFRGVHGGYWAIATGNVHLFGTTIHQVDTGIDTGQVLSQVSVMPEKTDSFFTYPYLQYAICLPELKRIITDYFNGGNLEFRKPLTDQSRLWYHPTIWQWFSLPRKV